MADSRRFRIDVWLDDVTLERIRARIRQTGAQGTDTQVRDFLRYCTELGLMDSVDSYESTEIIGEDS